MQIAANNPGLTLDAVVDWRKDCAPDACMPATFGNDALAVRLKPYRRIAGAIVLASMRCEPGDTDAERLAAMERWFLTTRDVYSFASVCDLLEVDPDALATYMRAHNGHPPQVRRTSGDGQSRIILWRESKAA